MIGATFDPRAVWRDLSDEARETIGAAAIAETMAVIGFSECLGGDNLIVIGELARRVLRTALIDAAQPQLFEEDGAPRVPDVGGLEP